MTKGSSNKEINAAVRLIELISLIKRLPIRVFVSQFIINEKTPQINAINVNSLLIASVI